MKKLTKSKRATVRFLLKEALHRLETAKLFTFKAYGSSDLTYHIKSALDSIESALGNLPKTKLPKDTNSSEVVKQGTHPVSSDDSPKDESVEQTLQDVVCHELGIRPIQCTPFARFKEDFGADDLDQIELAMSLEEELEITFSNTEVDNFSTYGKLLRLVKQKVAAKNKQSQG